VKTYLTSINKAFTEIDMASDEAARTFVIKKTGHLGSPVIQIGDEFIIGFDRKKIEKSLGQR
jgi:glutaredoxin